VNPVHLLSDTAKHTGDALSIGAIIASFFSWLPQVSALLAVVWFAMRIMESRQQQKINAQLIELNNRKLRDE
jgi:hypothetical protein